MARSLVLAALLLFGGGVPQAQDFTDPSTALSRAVGPFLQKNCQGCHSTSLPSGSVDMQQLIAAPNSLVDHRDTWENIAYQLRSGRMPPDAAPKPARADADAALELLSRALAASPNALGSRTAQAHLGRAPFYEAKAYAGADNPKAADNCVLGLVCRFETEGPSRLGRVVPESRFKDSRPSRDSDMLSGISKIEVWP